MTKKACVSVNVNIDDDFEIQTMDFLSQIMRMFEKNHEQYGIAGDCDLAKDRIAKWFFSKYCE